MATTKAKKQTKTPSKTKAAATVRKTSTRNAKSGTSSTERDQWLVIAWVALIVIFLAFVIKVYVVG